ncbi:MAG: 30S ribosome-binding factor RbfA [Bacilli bacterium]|nr:30S ribosome-binding factor RbfA [Bacilli bacterium]
MSIKTERLGNMLHKEISNIIMSEIKDEDLKFVTITKVDLSSDLSNAKVYFTTLNDDKEKVLKDLNRAKKFIRSNLMKRKIEMRIIPELSFVYDESIDYGNKIESLIEKIHEEDDN